MSIATSYAEANATKGNPDMSVLRLSTRMGEDMQYYYDRLCREVNAAGEAAFT
jgi:hypothetical protein